MINEVSDETNADNAEQIRLKVVSLPIFGFFDFHTITGTTLVFLRPR